MKKIITITLCTLILALIVTSGYTKEIKGVQGLLEKARTEISIANAEKTHLEILGSVIDGEKELFWFVSGNEYQEHLYFPLEFKKHKDEKYSFVKSYIPIEKSEGLCALLWNEGYCFLVDSPKCQYIVISDETGKLKHIEVNTRPFVYFIDFIPPQYSFVDYNGNIIA